MIRYNPADLLAEIAPRKELERLVTKRLTVNKAVLSRLSRQDFLSKKKAEQIALRVIKGYKKKYKVEKDAGETARAALETATNENALVVNRVENALVYEISQDIKKSYRGVRYVWTPSDAEEPDPLHQLNYGRRFTVGKGEMPGDRHGCRCGMDILVDDTELDLE